MYDVYLIINRTGTRLRVGSVEELPRDYAKGFTTNELVTAQFVPFGKRYCPDGSVYRDSGPRLDTMRCEFVPR